MDLSKYPNPYDFASPITDHQLFSGRNEELNEIKYYLDQASKVKKPINLAFIGERASGKTSLLNITEYEANKLNFCVVRIDLDEGDSQDEISFFFKLFDATFNATLEKNIFGGFYEKTYETYLNVITTGEIPEDKEFLPFLFPSFYAKVRKTNTPYHIPDNSLKRDFALLQNQIKTTIILLFDECDVLTQNKIILQKLRNIFMNLGGFMLVIAATPNLFPTLDDVFSPIIRQFMKINVDRFHTKEETEKCIERPLKKIGINYRDIIDGYSKDIEEIHEITNGKPYEIQLICHFMFKRLQEGKSNLMKLNYGVLEQVRIELEKTQNINSRPLLLKIKSLQNKELLALGKLCECNSHLSIKQISELEFIFSSKSVWKIGELEYYYNKFLEIRLVSVENDKIYFCGDDFDKIYIKYYSKEKNINVYINFIEADFLVWIRLRRYIERDFPGIKYFPALPYQNKQIDIDKIIEKYTSFEGNEDIFENEIPFIEELYWPMIEYREYPKFVFLQVVLKLPWMKLDSYFSIDCNCDISIHNIEFQKFLARIESQQGSLTFYTKYVEVIPISCLIKKVLLSANKNFKKALFYKHISSAIDLYIDNDLIESEYHALIAFEYLDKAFNENNSINNLGYLMMSFNKFEQARTMFIYSIESASSKDKTTVGQILSEYNLIIVNYIIEKSIQIKKLNELLKLCENFNENDRLMLAIKSLKNEEGKIVVQELKNKDILFAINETLIAFTKSGTEN